MQLIPLTGTITKLPGSGIELPDQDATHTPHGDDNFFSNTFYITNIIDATHTPHGDDNPFRAAGGSAPETGMQLIPLTGTITPQNLISCNI